MNVNSSNNGYELAFVGRHSLIDQLNVNHPCENDKIEKGYRSSSVSLHETLRTFCINYVLAIYFDLIID